MMCPNCGNQLEEGASFCPRCGTAVSGPVEAAIGSVEAPTQASPNLADDAPGAKKPAKKPGRRPGKKLVIGLVAVALIAGGGYAGYSYYQKTQWDNLVQSAATAVEQRADDEFGASFTGFVPNNYVNESSYSVTDFQMGDVNHNDDSVTGTATVTTQNESFCSTVDLTFSGTTASDGSLSDVDLSVADKSTVPLKGIDYDTSHGFENLDLPLDGDNHCSYDQDKPDSSAWYYASGIKEQYHYKFDEDSGWSFGDVVEVVPDDGKYADLSGTYTVPGGTNPDAYLTLSNYNPHDTSAGYSRPTYSLELSTDYELSGKTSGKMVFRKDNVALEELDGGLVGFNLGETGLVVGAKEITGAESGDCQLQIVMNPGTAGGVNVFSLEQGHSLRVFAGYQRVGNSVVQLRTYTTGGYLSGLPSLNASSFAQNPPAPQFVRE